MNGALKSISLITVFRVMLLLCVFTMAGNQLLAQVSAPIEEIDGKAFYMHTVEKSQTLYGISKLYKCKIEDITANNPGADVGLQEGQILRIPAPKAKIDTKVLEGKGTQTFTIHKVEKKETLFSIAKAYNVDVNALMAANPGAEAGIKKGQELRIPIVSISTTAPSPSVPGKRHIVEQGETLYSISKKYGVTVEAIQSANSGLLAGLRTGETIIIPGVAETVSTTSPSSPATSSNVPAKISLTGNTEETKYSIGLMLPFYTSVPDTVKLSEKERRIRDVAINMYRGAMLAADQLEKEGLSATLRVYNVEDSKSQANSIIGKAEAKDLDVIIGPSFREPLAEVAKWASKNDVHVVCPVPLGNKVLLSSSNMSKVSASDATQWEMIGKFIAKNHKNDNVILVNSTVLEEMKLLQAYSAAYLEATGDSAKEVKAVSGALPGFAGMLSATRRNVIVVPSNDKKVIPTVFAALKGENTIVYGPAEWENSDAISISNRNQFHVHYPRTTYLDFADKKTLDWVEQYKKKFKSDPTDYSAIGYDVMMYYGRGLNQYGKLFPNHFAEIKSDDLVGNIFDYFKTGAESGFENRHVYILGTSDFEIIKEN